MGQHIITGKDGSTLELNFSYDNGLPTKPIINPSYKTGYSEKNNFHVLSMYLNEEDLSNLGGLDIKQVFIFEKEIWLAIDNHYVVFGNVPNLIILEAKNKKLVYYFYKENGTFIDGVRVG